MMISRKDGAIDYRENTTFHFTLFEFSRWSIRLNLSWLFYKYTDYVTCLKRWDWGTLMNKLMGTKRITLNRWFSWLCFQCIDLIDTSEQAKNRLTTRVWISSKNSRAYCMVRKKEGVSKLLHWYGNYMLLDWYSCE